MKKIIKYILLFCILCGLIVFFINLYVILSVKNKIINDKKNVDAILVLGAGIWGEEPSPMLKDRLDTAIDLYNRGFSNKIIMSGDHGREEYDEVNTMKKYAIDEGIPSEDIFMDHAGFSTYDSIYRSKYIFECNSVVIVTQKYHLFRSLYISKALDIKAYGASADVRRYRGAIFREIREVLARNKDFVKSIFKSKPKYLGEVIPVSGSGDITNDKEQ